MYSRDPANIRNTPGFTLYPTLASITRDAYDSDSSLGVEVPPESPMISEADFCYTTDDDERKPVSSRVTATSIVEENKEDPHPDATLREEVFNELAYCGFLDVRQATLFRWAVGVVWSMHMFRQVHCSFNHRSFVPSSSPPRILYRLFAANAILPYHIRESATTRVLIVLHALYYLSKVPSCAVCLSKTRVDRLDLSLEDPRMFDGIDEAIVSRMVIEWSVAMRCAVAWLVDEPERNYWEIHTKHIPDKVGADITRLFQKCLDYKFSISNDDLMMMMNAITDDHPISLTPVSRKRHCPPGGLQGNMVNWNGLISTH